MTNDKKGSIMQDLDNLLSDTPVIPSKNPQQKPKPLNPSGAKKRAKEDFQEKKEFVRTSFNLDEVLYQMMLDYKHKNRQTMVNIVEEAVKEKFEREGFKGYDA